MLSAFPCAAPRCPTPRCISRGRASTHRAASPLARDVTAAVGKSEDAGAFVPRRRPRRRREDVDAEDDNGTTMRDRVDAHARASASSASETYARAYESAAQLERARDEARDARQSRRDAFAARRGACEAVIVVEGGADVRAVRLRGGFSQDRAKVLAVRHRGAFRRRPNGEMEVKRERMDEIERLSVKYDAPIVVLFDCDTAGRQLRNAFLTRFPDATHAFMGVFESSAKEDGKWHARGNVGVEHGEGEDIARAIARARRADPGRRAFTRADLVEWGLAADYASATDVWSEFGGVVNRRRLVGERLGVGDCDGRQLLRQLNLFFTEDEVRDALDALPARGEPIPPKMTDGRADRGYASPGNDENDDDDFRALGFDPMAYIPPGQALPGFE